MSEQSKEVVDALFQQKVLNYIDQDTKDKMEIKADLKAAREDIAAGKVNIAVLKTKTGIYGAIAGAIFAAISEWLFSLFHK
jgi:hypothetical protein